MGERTDEFRELEEEAEAANVLANQASRTLAQAREAVAAARRDRNSGIVQQPQPIRRQYHEGQWQDWMGKARGKGQKFTGLPMPKQLWGGVATTEDGQHLCFGYNLGTCQACEAGKECPKGLHKCCYEGCGATLRAGFGIGNPWKF